MSELKWVQPLLGDVAGVIDPHPSHRAPPEVDGGVPFVGIGDLTERGEVCASSARKVSPRVLEEHKARYLVASGDIAYGRVATVGKVMRFGEITGPFALSPTMALIQPHGVAASYLAHFLQSKQWDVESAKLLTGTTRSSLGIQLLRKIRISCPQTSEEQIAIGRILDTLDTAIHETEAIIAKLKALKQGLLHDLLTRGIDANGELRPPQAEAPHRYKGSPLGWIPKEWEEVTLGEIARRSGGFLQTGPFGSQLHAHEYVLDGIPVIMPQDMVNGELSTESIAQINPRKAVTLSRHRVQLNDVVFSRRGDLSLCVAIEEKHLGWLCGTGCLLARLPSHEINGYWLALVYSQPGLQTQVMGRAVGSTMANLNTSILAAITIARPPIAEQEEISKRLKSIGKRIRQEEEELKKRRSEKTGLMDDLLTGRVSVAALIQNNGDLDG